ncbi:hypothetical protein ACI2KT_13105 [Ensifer adhaerens]|uniref:hypothetical protein n=1 Tax=Ensifer TaxID=106591 RepID=UPI000761AE3B|nr:MULTISPECIES: hypothetical protein [Ensifer]MBD9557878.1 hypothetical protein [Ensifer sp. ENS03]MBD9571319.1 hypothetical protein [Ensifer sp. ENS08]MBD9624542.1 hypothetical protein [Ensifer sp. ENS06]MBW0368447.1 hypothetical protein [Ensifer adhaerens]UCM23000.1 hypothetical protein LDL63_24975 [Ensifer adhaerens]
MTRSRGRISFAVLAAIAVTACQSQDKGPQPRFVSSYAGTTSQQRDQGYFIEFRSRYALSYGHSYVIFGRLSKSGAMISPEVAGLAPATSDTAPYVIGHLLPVPAETGASDGDLEEQYRSASWRVMLTETQYRDVVAKIRKLKSEARFWQASIYNCNAFVADIARSMGYKTPGIWLRPQQFITRLREMNGG